MIKGCARFNVLVLEREAVEVFGSFRLGSKDSLHNKAGAVHRDMDFHISTICLETSATWTVFEWA